MATREQAIINAKYFLKMYKSREFIYRVGSAWMHTGQSKEVVQEVYIRKIQDYQEVKLSDTND